MDIAEKLKNNEDFDYEFSSPFYEEENELSRKDAMEEFMYLGLRKIEGIYRGDFYQMFNRDIDSVYGPLITALRQKGFIDAAEGRIFLTDIGIDISNQILAQFLLD